MKKLLITITAIALGLCSGQAIARPNHRVIALYTMKYDGSQFVRTGDSVRSYFSGNHSYADVYGEDIPDALLTIFNPEQTLPSFPEEYSRIFSICDSTINYGLNAAGTVYTDRNQTTIATLDVDGNISELLNRKKSGTNWENGYKRIYTYDASGKITTYIYQLWQAGTWKNIDKEVSVYNSAGKLENFTRQNWDAGSWENNKNYLYEYDASGNCTSAIERQWTGSTWKNVRRNTLVYTTDGQSENQVFYTWTGSEWKTSNQVLITYNSNGSPSTIRQQIWDGSAWVDYTRQTYTYSGTQKTESMQEKYDADVWNKQVKVIYTYNSSGDLEKMTMQEWNDPTSDWLNNYSMNVEYNSEHLKSAIFRESWNAGGYWEKTTGSAKYMFFYEAYGDDNSGIASLDAELNLSIYPNPTSEILNVIIDWEVPQPAMLTVYDVNGRVCSSQALDKMNHMQTAIDVSALRTGSYYLKVATAKGHMARGFQIVR